MLFQHKENISSRNIIVGFTGLLKLMCWKPEKCKDLSEFDKDQLVTAGQQLDQSISRMFFVVFLVCSN